MAGRIFKNAKLNAMNNKKVSRYLLYALGEIILVVAGILIALTINNANDSKKQLAQLNGIFSTVQSDLIIDTTVVGRMITFYESRETIADSIAQGKMTPESYKSCIICPSLLTIYVPINLNDKGYTQLKNFNQTSEQKDSLATEMILFYTSFFGLIEPVQERLETSTYGTLENWRDTMPWFSELMSGNLPPAYIEYMSSSSSDYRNRVAYYNIIACKNLLPILKSYKENAAEALERIEKRLEQTGG